MEDFDTIKMLVKGAEKEITASGIEGWPSHREFQFLQKVYGWRRRMLNNLKSGPIDVKSFHIWSPGDPSVGIPDASWTLQGECYFDDQEELQEFKDRLRESFEYVSDGPVRIMTDKEYELEINEPM